MMWTLHEGDCLEIMRKMPDNSIDAIITDPPYGIDYQSARRIDKSQWKEKIANDKHPFIWWIYDAFRVIKENGALACFCRWDVQDAFKSAIEWAGFEVKSQIIWDREIHGMGDLKASFSPQHDVIWFATKGDYRFYSKRPSSVIRVQKVSPENLLHPNQKPLNLMQHLIECIVPKTGTVLDPFAGSGTTLLAAEQLNRDSIGIELEPKYCQIIKQRMNNIQQAITFEDAAE